MAVVSTTLVLAAAFMPIALLRGSVGALFREFAVTMAVAVLVSMVVSLTLTPMLCSRFLRVPTHESHGRLYRITESVLQAMLGLYDRTLKVCLRHRLATMLASVAVLAGTIWMFMVIPKGFIPDEDTNQIAGVTEASQGISFYQLINYQRAAARVIQKDPDVEAFMSTIGGTAATNLGGPNYGQFTIRLKPRSKRTRTVAQIIADLRPKLDDLPGINVYLQNPPTINLSGQITKSQYQFSLQSANKAELYENANKMQELISQLKGVEDVTSNLAVTAPQVDVSIDRDKAAALQTDANSVESAFYDAYGQHWVSTIYASVNEYKVLLELQRQYQIGRAHV